MFVFVFLVNSNGGKIYIVLLLLVGECGLVLMGLSYLLVLRGWEV